MARHLKSILVTVITAFASQYSFAQFSDDFSDPDLNSRPTWSISNVSGKGTDFQVIGGVLQSNGPAAGATLWISTDNVAQLSSGKTVWTFKARYGSAPSGSNNIRIFLASDQQDLSQDPTGYYIRLGESGSEDGIDLFKTGASTPLIRDPNPSIANGINVSIRVSRDAGGHWTLEADRAGGSDFMEIGVAKDTEFTAGGFFGITIRHTSTRSKDFYFDDIAVKHEDNVPPQLRAIVAHSATQLALTYSEAVNPVSAEKVVYYTINNGIGNPISASIDPADAAVVQLTLASPLMNATGYKLMVTAVEDLMGNSIDNAAIDLFYFKAELPHVKDVIINEIFADPDPANDLPGSEYIEIYNNSNKVFDLSGWSFSDRSSTGTMGTLIFRPGDFLILCPEASIEQFRPYGNVMGLAVWPTLNNSGDAIVLKNKDGFMVDSIYYDNGWYNSSSKGAGGWALELIDPNNFCSDRSNWAAAEDPSGGTPGRENSVRSNQPDLTGPELVDVMAFRPDYIRVRFNEILDPGNALTATYKIDPEVDIANIEIDDNLREIHLYLTEQLESAKDYMLTVTALTDCSGNLIRDANWATFHLVQPADSADVVINEILFNPRPGGVDFVEVYNRSSKYINLKEWYLANGDDKKNSGVQVISITGEDIILKPSEYAAFTTDVVILKEQYPFGKASNFMAVSALPSFPDDAGAVILMQKDSLIIDRFSYSEDHHFDLLADEEGVSLERIAFNGPANNADNWRSAASTVGFATPGYKNSQIRAGIQRKRGEIVIDPRIIIPDGSGRQGYATISYSFSQPGYVANARVVDVYGRTVRVLSENDYLPAEGFYTWDATDEAGRKVRIGYYLIYFEVFDLEGNTLTFKEKVVVGTRF